MSPLECDDDDSCRGCALAPRRTFLLGMSGAVLAAMVGTTWDSDAAMLPLEMASGAQSGGNVRTYAVPAEDGATIDRDAQVILVRLHGQGYAFNLACPHENTVLRWRPEDSRFQCPRHGSRYQPDGTFISGRATRNMDRFAIRRTPEGLVVDLDRLYRSDRNQAEWAGATVAL